MTTVSTLAATFITIITLSTAQAYERKTTDKKVEGVNLSESVTLSELDNLQLKSVASGVRKKYIVVGIDVYVAELLLPPTVNWDKKQATVESSPQAGILMHFVREVPAKKISESFAEGLEGNAVDSKAPEVGKFLDAIKKIGDIKKKESLVVARSQTKEGDKVLIMVPDRFQEVVTGPAGWSQSILKIWTGKPNDKGLRELQKELF